MKRPSTNQLPFAFGDEPCSMVFPSFDAVEPVDPRAEADKQRAARCARVIAYQPPSLPAEAYEDDPDDPVLQVKLYGRLEAEYPRMNGRRWVF